MNKNEYSKEQVEVVGLGYKDGKPIASPEYFEKGKMIVIQTKNRAA